MFGFLKKMMGGEGKQEKKKIEIPKIESCAVTPMEVKERLDSGHSFHLIDVREAHELDIAAIPQAKHIPMSEIHARYKEISDDPSAEIVVFCHHGRRSEQVMTQLWGLGFQNTKNMEGGIHAWAEQVDSSIATY